MSAPEGFVGLFLARAAAEPERVFARFEGRPISFGALERASAAFAAGLAGRGLGPGSRVAAMMRNGPEALAVILGLARAGMVWVPVNARQRGAGLRHVLEHAEPALLVADADLLPEVAACGAPPLPNVVNGGEGANDLSALLSGDPDLPERTRGWVPPAAEAALAIMYTSGTTGPPKGVIVTHGMLRLAGEAVALVSGARDGDALFVWEPLYHVGGAQLLVLPLIRRVHLAMVARFSAGRFWDEVREAGATHVHYLGGILQLLLKQPPSARDRDHPVRIAWGGGCPAGTWEAFRDRFGVAIRECYGMTEASSITTVNEAGAVGAVGRPLPWFAVDLLDPEGRPVAPGERGEIVVRATRPGAIFPGYFRDPGATARALRDGALRTGDVGSLDAAGNLRFHGRTSDSLRCRGENVSAWEVEHVAAAHPAVEDCAVVGVEAEVGEQDVKLFVQPRPGAAPDAARLAAELFAWLGARLAPYQVPRYLALVEAFERTPSQRIMKHGLSRARDDGYDRLAEP